MRIETIIIGSAVGIIFGSFAGHVVGAAFGAVGAAISLGNPRLERRSAAEGRTKGAIGGLFIGLISGILCAVSNCNFGGAIAGAVTGGSVFALGAGIIGATETHRRIRRMTFLGVIGLVPGALLGALTGLFFAFLIDHTFRR